MSRARRQKKATASQLPKGLKPTGRKGEAKITRLALQRLLEARRTAQRERTRYKQAKAARDDYKPRKSDRGNLVFIGTKGQRGPEAKGRKGYLIYVTKTGKKWLLKQEGRRGKYSPRKLTDIEPPTNKTLHKKAQAFNTRKLVKVREAEAERPAVKGRGETAVKGGYDFNDSIVGKMARDVKRTIERQASQRIFVVRVNALVKLPDGTTQAFSVDVPIAKPDHISIKLAGMINFVRQKVYAFLARELSYSGYVTSGSANHVRRLSENDGVERGEWTKDGVDWKGNSLEVVTIKRLEWQILQARK